MKPEAEWSVLLRDRHDGYIGWDEYERNRRVIEANTVGNRGAPRAGKALLAGLLRCGRCGGRLQVENNGKSHRYQCPGDVRTGGSVCIGFGGVRADGAVGAAVLAAAQPLGVAAALEAFERRGDDASARIGLAASALEEARYKAGRAQAQFDAVDPANANIIRNLAARWEACLAEVSEREEQLRDLEAAREAREAGSADRDAWLALGADLERAWSHEDATPQLRRNVLRAALVEIAASLRKDTVHLLLHWRGGDHTEIEVRRFRTGEHRCKSDKDVEDLVAGLARQPSDEQTARLLNRLGRRTGKGNGWNRDRVRAFRSHRGIPGYREGERQERGELSLSEASAHLGVDPSVVRRLIRASILPARQVCTGAPWAIAAADLEAPRVVAALSGCRSVAGADPNQGAFGF